jgi:hypothetical protein
MNTQTSQTQSNLYNVISSNGIPSKVYVTASNIKDAHKIVKKEHSSFGLNYKLKRCYNGGIRG